jgi:cytidine deaminase
MRKTEIISSFIQYDSPKELSEQEQQLIQQSINAQENSHSPYSKFSVGAALLLKSGKIILGSNQENVAYPSGLCAERVALFNYGANYPNDEILAIAISATDRVNVFNDIVKPCGSCLQVMAEYQMKQKQKIKVLLYGNDGKVLITEGIDQLLPLQFSFRK